MSDLSSSYLGLRLRTPLVASSSPLTGKLDDLRRLEDAGIAAVVLPSLFEEQIEHESLEVHRLLETGAESFAEAQSYFPELDQYATGPESYLELVRAARAALGIPVIASLNGASPGGWVEYARRIEEAGAHALELNLYVVAADPELCGERLEARERELVASVKREIGIPLAVKISPFFSALAHAARGLAAAGADALVLFNRFYQPDLDLEALAVRPSLTLSCSEELRLPLRWIALLYGRVSAGLAASTGIHTAADALKALLAGADVAMMASALLESGPDHVRRMERDLREWLDLHEYASVSQLRGSLSQRAAPDPSAFERAQYRRTLHVWSSSFRG